MPDLENLAADDLKGKSRADLLAICKERGYKATGWDKGKMLAVLTGEEAPPVSKAERKKKIEKAIEERKSSGSDSDEPVTGKEASAQERMKARTGHCAAIGCTCEVWLPNGMDGNRFWPTCSCGHTQWVHAKPEDKRPEPQEASQVAVEAPTEPDEAAAAQPEGEAPEAPEEAPTAAEEQA